MELLLGQFADDMDIYQLFDQESLNAIVNILDTFHMHSGFTINYDKTQMYRIGSLKNIAAKLVTQKGIVWTNEPINVLGVYIAHDSETLIKLNYKPLVDRVSGILESWKRRNLSLIGKIQIVNTLIASLFVYKFTVLEEMPEEMIVKIESIIEKFLWNSHKPKISMKILQSSKSSGGLGLCNLRWKDKSLKIGWIKILHEHQTLAQLVYEQIQPQLKHMFWYCNMYRKIDVVNYFKRLRSKNASGNKQQYLGLPCQKMKHSEKTVFG